MTQQWIDFRLLKERLSFEEVLQYYKIELKRKMRAAATSFTAFARFPPQRPEEIPSFSVNVERNAFSVSAARPRAIT